MLLEGNDSRGIDVAVVSRLPIVYQRSHARRTFGALGVTPPPGQTINDYAFRRDCLEVDVAKEGRALTLFICHFKSMHGGRRKTRHVRLAEVAAVRQLVRLRFARPAEEDRVVLEDLNDYREVDSHPVGHSGLGPLLDDGFAVDLAPHAIPDAFDRWTHHYPEDDTYGALDHIMLSPRLAAQNPAPETTIIQDGSPYHAARYTRPRFPGIGWLAPKASDHCPMAATIKFEGRALSA